MIDPVYLTSLQRTNLVSLDSSERTRKDKTASKSDLYTPDTKSTLSTSSLDSANFHFNLRGDLQSLQDSVNTINEEIKKQVERYYGLRGEEGETDNTQYVPPEDASAQQLMDFYSPTNTSQRILNFTTGFFSQYQANHTDSSDETNINAFTTLIGDAIKKGFGEAEKILGSFDELGQVGETIKKTYGMVMKGLEEFRLSHLNDLGLMPEDTEDPTDETGNQESTDLNVVG